MTFGDPVVFYCPSCNKPMQMITCRSYTTLGGSLFSDGRQTGGHGFTPDLVKCPNCGAVFFRHNIWAAKTMSMSDAAYIKYVKTPDRADYIKALEKGLAKNRDEESQLREYLWRDLNNIIRHSGALAESKYLELWKENCAVLLSLKEKSLEEMTNLKNAKKYDESEWFKALIMTAELNRNLGNFDECMNKLNSLSGSRDWLKTQFEWECEAKNIFTFELLSESQMNLERFDGAKAGDYYERASVLTKRRRYKSALADYSKALELGFHGTGILLDRGRLYAETFNDYEKAFNDFEKALETALDNNEKASALRERGKLYKNKGDLHSALDDLNKAVALNDSWGDLYHERKEIHEASGNAEAARWDAFKEKLIKDAEYQMEARKATREFFSPLLARLYAERSKPIRDVINKEDLIILACMLIAEEDYEYLERYVKEGISFNGLVPSYFMEFQPTPFYYATTKQMRSVIKEPRTMLKWLVDNGADPNMAAGDKSTPLGNQCGAGGDLQTLKYLLQAGADPNVKSFYEDDYYKPLSFAVSIDWENDPAIDKNEVLKYFTQEDADHLRKTAALLREYGATTE